MFNVCEEVTFAHRPQVSFFTGQLGVVETLPVRPSAFLLTVGAYRGQAAQSASPAMQEHTGPRSQVGCKRPGRKQVYRDREWAATGVR